MVARPEALIRDAGVARRLAPDLDLVRRPMRGPGKALPVRRLQSRQWQTELRIGSPVATAERAPQVQRASRVVMERA